MQKARLVNLETMSDASDDISKICVALLVLFFVLVVAAAIASVFTISWCALVANLIGIIELLAVYFFVFAGKFSIDPTDTSITSRVAPALTMILIVLLVLAAIMSVASVIVSYAVHEDEEAFVDDWNSNDPSRDAETNLVDDGNATTVPATANSMTVVASLIQMNTNRSFAIYNNTEVVIGKGSQANIIVSNPIISRAHAKISCRNGVCTIQDLGSKNGTFVGDEKILGSNTVTLANGMYITLGNEIFQLKNRAGKVLGRGEIKDGGSGRKTLSRLLSGSDGAWGVSELRVSCRRIFCSERLSGTVHHSERKIPVGQEFGTVRFRNYVSC